MNRYLEPAAVAAEKQNDELLVTGCFTGPLLTPSSPCPLKPHQLSSTHSGSLPIQRGQPNVDVTDQLNDDDEERLRKKSKKRSHRYYDDSRVGRSREVAPFNGVRPRDRAPSPRSPPNRRRKTSSPEEFSAAANGDSRVVHRAASSSAKSTNSCLYDELIEHSKRLQRRRKVPVAEEFSRGLEKLVRSRLRRANAALGHSVEDRFPRKRGFDSSGSDDEEAEKPVVKKRRIIREDSTFISSFCDTSVDSVNHKNIAESVSRVVKKASSKPFANKPTVHMATADTSTANNANVYKRKVHKPRKHIFKYVAKPFGDLLFANLPVFDFYSEFPLPSLEPRGEKFNLFHFKIDI